VLLTEPRRFWMKPPTLVVPMASRGQLDDDSWMRTAEGCPARTTISTVTLSSDVLRPLSCRAA
jgi:hypothetical protein